MANLANYDIALTNYNQRTGRYGLAISSSHDVAMDDTQAYAVQTAAACVKGAWGPDVTLGSDLSTLKHITARTPSQARTMIQEALDPLVRLNKIAADPVIQPVQKVIGPVNALSFDVDWSTPGGAQQKGSVQL